MVVLEQDMEVLAGVVGGHSIQRYSLFAHN